METEFTHFAPAERAKKEKISRDFENFAQLEYVKKIMDAFPYLALILNRERQIVFYNQTILDVFGITNPESLVGQRPGEMANCVHSDDTSGGCGTTEYCKYCGAVKAIMTSIENQIKVTEECRITTLKEGKNESLDLKVTASPFYLNSEQFTILSLNDNSNEKRRKAIERIFFHDVINSASGLDGFIGFLKDSNTNPESVEYIDTAQKLSQSLLDEIVAQREIVNAENGELLVNQKLVNSLDLVKEVVEFMSFHVVTHEKSINIDESSNSAVLKTDPVLLRRVLVNMLKNSLEAVKINDSVKIGCISKNDSIVFWVQNPGVMPDYVQKQIFQRSFSSKGQGRGLGTYSMKMITDQYLKGRIDFESNEEKGTIFRVRIPLF